jgi:hypothetical protein
MEDKRRYYFKDDGAVTECKKPSDKCEHKHYDTPYVAYFFFQKKMEVEIGYTYNGTKVRKRVKNGIVQRKYVGI